MVNTLKEGYYVELVVTGNPDPVGFRKVGASEPFEYETGTSDTAEFSSVSAGAESSFQNIPNLEPDDTPPHLYHVLWGVRDRCLYSIKIPTGTNRLGVDKDLDVGFITNEKSPYFAPNPDYAFWLIENYYPAVNAKNGDARNPAVGAITPKVYFKGTKYDITKVEDKKILILLNNYKNGVSPGIPFTTITIGGVKL